GVSPGVMSMVANTMLGLASSAVGMPGMLPVMAGMAMGGSQAMQRQGGAVDPSQSVAVHEDPAAFSADPPPDSARLGTKVAWCEMQLFGHTSVDLHLPERLRQISDQLDLDTHKSNIELMDEVPNFIKAIQAKKPPRPAIG